MLDEGKPPSPHKKQPSPVRQTLDKPIYEIKLPENSKITEADSSALENTNQSNNLIVTNTGIIEDK